MAREQIQIILRHLRRSVGASSAAAVTDSQLLERFVQERDEAAFELLVRRHERMVWHVCRRILHEPHDAEDAFQAAFLVLVRKAGSVRKRDSLASWLYRVAYRVALRASANRAKLVARERQGFDLSLAADAHDPANEIVWRELGPALDQEVSRLPEKYRAPFVLCYLEGKTYVEAAQQLGWPKGTVSTRLTRARELLRGRLARRGVALTTGGLATALFRDLAQASVPRAVVGSTIKAALLLTAGKGMAGAVSGTVLALAEGAIKGMFVSQLKIAGALLVALSIVAAGVGLAMQQASGTKQPSGNQVDPPRPLAEARALPPPEAEIKDRARTDRDGNPLPPGAVARMGTVRFRHGNLVYFMTVSPDGKFLALEDSNGKFRLWKLATGKELHQWKAFDGMGAHAATFSADSKTVAAVGLDRSVRVWDVATGKELRSLPGLPRVTRASAFAFAADGKVLATAGGAGQHIQLWDTTTGKELQKLSGGGGALALTFSADGRFLASARGGLISLWNLATGEELRQLKGHESAVTVLRFSPDGKTLASWSNRGTARIWDAVTGKQLHCCSEYEGNTDRTIGLPAGNRLDFAPDGKTLAVGDWRGTIRLWDVATGKIVHRLAAVPGWRWPQVAYSPDGKTLITADLILRRWDAATGKELQSPAGHEGGIASVALSPDGKVTATASADRTIRLWETGTGNELRVLRGHSRGIRAMLFARDGKTLISGSSDKTIRVWDAHTGQELRQFPRTAGPVEALVLSPDGRTLAAAGNEGASQGGKDYAIRLWEVATGKERRQILGHRDYVTALDFSPDGVTLVSASGDGTTRVWNLITGKELRRLGDQGNHVYALGFSPDGRTVVTSGTDANGATQRWLSLWDVATGEERQRVPTNYRVGRAAFSPDGWTLAYSAGATIHLWDVLAEEEIRQLPGHPAEVYALAFSSDGRILVTGGAEGSALVWDLTGESWERPPRRGPFSATDLDELWANLTGTDAVKAYQASWQLVRKRVQAVRFLGEHLRPVPAADPRRLSGLLADLESDQFAARERASAELAQMGKEAELALRQKLQVPTSEGFRVRAAALLKRFDQSAEGRAALGSLRALAVLERIGSPEARLLLEILAKGEPAARLTQEAKAALARLTRGSAADPLKQLEPTVARLRPIPSEQLFASETRLPQRTDCQGDLLPPGALARLGTARWQPGDIVHSLAFSADGQTLVSGGREVQLWETATGRLRKHLATDTYGTTLVSVSPNGKLLAYGSLKGVIHLVDLATGTEKRRHNGQNGRGRTIAFSPDSKQLATCGNDYRLHLWDVATGNEVQRLDGHDGGTSCVAFCPDGRLLASGGADRKVRVWDLTTGKEVQQYPGYSIAGNVAFSPDGKILAAGMAGVQLWETATGNELHQLKRRGSIDCLVFSPDGKWLTAASMDDKIIPLWEVSSGKEVRRFEGHQDWVSTVAFSPDNKTLASGGYDRTIRLWDVATGKELPGKGGHRGMVHGVAFAPDGKTISTASGDQSVRLWDAAMGQELRQFLGEPGGRTTVFLSPDGKMAFRGGWDGSMRLWDIATGKELCHPPPNNGPFLHAAFSRDGKTLAVVASMGVEVWDIATGKLRITVRTQFPESGLAFSPDDRTLVSGDLDPNKGEIILRDAATGAERQRLRGQSTGLATPAFTADGKTLIVGNEDIRLWELTTGKVRCWLSRGGGYHSTTSLALSPDGRTLATGATDHMIHLWDLFTGKKIGSLPGHLGRIQALAFSADGNRLVSGSWDNTALVWDVTTLATRDRDPVASLSEKDLNELWTDLADADAERAYQAIGRLAVASIQTVGFLPTRLRPASPAETRWIDQLIADLDSDQFSVRERASDELGKLGWLAESALRSALTTQPSAEIRGRVEKLLKEIGPIRLPEALQALRSVEVLERIATPEAKRLLETLTQGATEALLTREAKVALRRLAQRARK